MRKVLIIGETADWSMVLLFIILIKILLRIRKEDQRIPTDIFIRSLSISL